MGVLRTVVIASEKDQPMIESGAEAVYEAIVGRKSRAAIWRAAGRGRRAGRVPDPVPGGPAGRNLGLGARRIPKSRPAGRPTLSADETNPL
ncbi:hypothetical protein DF048_33895 [Burkholderia seminalis]|nr:hypothetical protein DF048_33895 [Burkholderia seminalis]